MYPQPLPPSARIPRSFLYCLSWRSPSVLCLSLPLSVLTLSSLPSFSFKKIFCSLQLMHLAEVSLGISGNFPDRSWVEFPKSINLVLVLYKQQACQTPDSVRQPQNVVPPCRLSLWITSYSRDTVVSAVTQQGMTTSITRAEAGMDLALVPSFLSAPSALLGNCPFKCLWRSHGC